jgi:hypothetical protein
VITLTRLDKFVTDHRPHGALAGDATEPAWNGYSSPWFALAASHLSAGSRPGELDLLRAASLN